MVPLRGWAPKGQRLRGFAPQGRWRTLTFLGALRWDGITAPCIFDGPINGQCFRAYVEQLLLPALRQGDIVVLDNLGSHKAKALRPMLKAVGRKALVSPALLTGSQPDREGLLQDQTLDEARPEAHPRRPLAVHRRPSQDHPTIRMLQLHSQRRICSRQNVKRSRRDNREIWRPEQGSSARLFVAPDVPRSWWIEQDEVCPPFDSPRSTACGPAGMRWKEICWKFGLARAAAHDHRLLHCVIARQLNVGAG